MSGTDEQRARMDRTALIAAAGVVGVMAIMLGRVIQLQVAPSVQLQPFITDRLTKITEEAPCGDLTDCRGRQLAVSKFGYRVFVDPLEFPNPPGPAISLLADAVGMKPQEVAKRLAPAMEGNTEIIDAHSGDDPPEETSKLKRYITIGGVLEDWRVESVKALRIDNKPIPGVHLETRPVREYTAAAIAASIVGMVGSDMIGLSGAEKMFTPYVQPEKGSLKYVRDARGEPMWIYPGGYTPPARGRDIRLSLDLEVQNIVVEELKRGVAEADAAGGRCVVLDPYSGEIMAMADYVRPCKDAKDYDWNAPIPKGGNGTRYRIIPKDIQAAIDPALGRNRCVEDVYEPGSTFKAFMWSTCLMHGVTNVNEVFNTYNGHWKTPYGRPVTDVHPKDHLKWTEVLVQSSNIGMTQAVSRLSFTQARDAIVSLGFGKRAGLGLPGESPGMVTTEKDWSKYSQTSVAFGYEVGVTPVQMVRAFSAYCRKGDLMGTIPSVRFTATDFDSAMADPGRRVFPSSIAQTTKETMKGVTDGLDDKLAKQHEFFRYEAFGKSGTAQAPLGKPPAGKKKPKGSDGYFGGQYNVSFIAGGPYEDPRVVVLVVVDDPGPDLVKNKRYFGSAVAGPINRRIMERTLSYMGVTPSVPYGQSVAGAHEEQAGR
jgi:cell division protein FtsI (penicillin-binding protein 3)